MLRIYFNRYGGPEELHLSEVALAAPAKDQSRVRLQAASVHPVDWKFREGVLKMMTGSKFPKGMGQDFAGVVDAVGSEVKRFKPGDEVFGVMDMKQAAAFAEVLLTGESTAVLRPRALPVEQAAAVATVGQTAWLALVDTGHLQAGQRVFVNGCLGSVGRCAVQICRMFGAHVSGTCSQDGLAEAKAMGVEQPVDYRRFQPEAYRGKFDLILDASGNLSTGQCSLMLRGKGLAMHINATFPKMLRVMFARHNKLVFLKRDPALLQKVSDAAAQGKLTLPIGKTVPLSAAIAAVTELETKGTPKGKVIITPA